MLAFDGIDKVDSASLIVIYRLICRGIPLLLTATNMGPLKNVLELGKSTVLKCDRLSPEECAALISDIEGGEAHANQLHDVCNGNAFWVRQSAICASILQNWDFIKEIPESWDSTLENFVSSRLECAAPILKSIFCMHSLHMACPLERRI